MKRIRNKNLKKIDLSKLEEAIKCDPKSINWKYLSENIELTEEFAKKYNNHIDINSFIRNQSPSMEFLEKNIKRIDFYYLSFVPLEEGFIEKHINKLNMYYVCKHSNLSEPFLRKNSKHINFSIISQYQKLSEKFMNDFASQLNWLYISVSQKLSENMIEKYKTKISWNNICEYQKLSEKFIVKYIKKIDWFNVFIFQDLSKEFLKKYKNKFLSIIDEYEWEEISYELPLKINFIREFSDKIKFDLLSKNRKINKKIKKIVGVFI